ncbi:hypothetical protein [Vermiculatibacterium agrestimuris]|uniref:hypothetical protein n=1 Tax=Vermiculatibacterium agrestimuris TaxID=2941519 RepID=UPI00203D58D3|nr:hypothetical protein [Vermiculatibacterium agrestimuris]
MKKGLLALILAACLPLTGCSAMLERSYEAGQRHEEKPVTAEGSSGLRVENYRELVSAVLYLVSQGQEEGTIQLYDYDGEVESDLTRACLEVATEDPLGAYCVDYIKHESSRVVSYYQAKLSISYRRTQEEIRSMVNVTGSGAIRAELQEALTNFSDQVVLRVAYFAEDEASILALARQAYYDTPAAALGMPQVEIGLYPDSGRERVVEILLTYSEGAEELRRKSARLAAAGAEFVYPWDMDREAAVRQAAAEVCYHSGYDPQGGVTAYAALVEGAANDEGLALAYSLVCRELERVTCEIVEGAWQGEPHFWNEVRFSQGEPLYLDLSRFTELSSTLYTADEMADMGYRWAGGPAEESPEESPQASENTL